MHPCLQLLDIVFIIIDFAYTTPSLHTDDRKSSKYTPPGHDTSTALSFALTCRAFLDPSLDALWSKQISLRPLMSCFPSVLSEDGSERVGL